jgi:hypothetical protein
MQAQRLEGKGDDIAAEAAWEQAQCLLNSRCAALDHTCKEHPLALEDA